MSVAERALLVFSLVSSTLDFQMWALANYNVNYGSLFDVEVGSLVAATLSNVGEAFEEMVIRAKAR